MFRTILLLSLLASPAMAFQARNDAKVTGTADQTTVAARPGLSAPESWCAAGDFVIRGLGLAASTPIYRLSPPPRRSGEAVVFSLSPDGAAQRSGLLKLGPAEAPISAGHAQALCVWGRARF